MIPNKFSGLLARKAAVFALLKDLFGEVLVLAVLYVAGPTIGFLMTLLRAASSGKRPAVELKH